MTKSKLIGKSKSHTVFDKSGVYTASELVPLKYTNENLYQKSQKNAISDSFVEAVGNRDIYNNHVAFHISGPIYDTHILKDQSGNNFDEFLYANEYRNETEIHEAGPKEYHCVHCWDTGYEVYDHTNIQLGSSNFTIEFWMKTGRLWTAETYIMAKGSGTGRNTGGTGWVIYFTTANLIGFYDGLSNTSTVSSSAISHDVWTHIAIVRSGTSTLKIYKDGTLVGTGTSSGNFTDNNSMLIGRDRWNNDNTYYGGYIFDLRIKTSAVYTANFTRPSDILDMTGSAFSLSGADPWHPYDIQKEGLTVVGMRGNWDIRKISDSPFFVKFPRPTGSGMSCSLKLQDRGIQIADKKPGKSLAFGTGAFTVECWVFPSYGSAGGYYGIAGKGTGDAGAGTGWNLLVDAYNLNWVDGSTFLTSSFHLLSMCWNHVAAVREGTGTDQFKIYVNGQLGYTGTVSSNYNQTNPLVIGASRNHQYGPDGTRYFGFKISNVARYTGAFTIDRSTFYDTVATNDANTLLYMIDSKDKRARPLKPQYINDGYELISVRSRGTTGQHRTGNNGVNAGNTSIQYVQGNANSTLLAQTSASSFTFTGDFSIEFWCCTNYEWERVYDSTPRIFLDCRTAFNDPVGFAIRYDYRSLQLINGGIVIMSDGTFTMPQRAWIHICLQRTSGNLALYINGDKRVEGYYSGTLGAATNNKIYFMNGVYNVREDNQFYGWFSDIRILKGSSAYGVGSSNPDKFRVPTEPVTAVTNTVLLISASSPTLIDSSTVGNQVWPGARTDANYTSTWDIFTVPFGPYSTLDRTNAMVVDVWDDGYSGACCEPDSNRYNNQSIEGTWLMRLTKPWTIETWFYPLSDNPSTTSARIVMYTANDPNRNGWQLIWHYSGTAESYGDLSFRWFLERQGTTEHISTTGGTGNFRPHSNNHVAIVFDPTKTNKVALFVNGNRVATRAIFTQATQFYTWDRLEHAGFQGSGDIRISDVARYNNDSTTYTVPNSAAWARDTNTPVLIKMDNNLRINSQQIPGMLDGLIKPSYQYTKWGSGSIALGNYDPSVGCFDRIFLSPASGWWPNRVMADPRYGDFTIEGWAQWKDATAGGRAIPNTNPGACLLHWANNIWVGLNSAGNWIARRRWWQTTYYTPTLINTVPVATSTAGTWNHWCLSRNAGDYTLYVNGIVVCVLYGANHWTYTSNGPADSTQSTHDDWYNVNDIRLGYEYNSDWATNGYNWTGHVEDFRITALARYQTVLINGVASMCHVGTKISGIPTAAFGTS
jgi:hypothetical protein